VRLPIVGHFEPRVTRDERAQAVRLAEAMRCAQPELEIPEQFRPHVANRLHDVPALHLDDLSAIPMLDRDGSVLFLQGRAALRAGDGDFVATCTGACPVFEDYCRDRLGLGAPQWLHPRPDGAPARVALSCWEDRAVRRELVRELRARRLGAIHPHMGTTDVWELAALLHGASRRPLQVIAPPPGLTAWVNNKLAFADVVRRLLGEDRIPRTEIAPSLAILSAKVRDLAESCPAISLKLPDSAGGGGTLVLEGARYRGRPLATIRDALKARLRGLRWHGQSDLLVGGWETSVLSSPSAQLWIPPRGEGDPIVEGLYEQWLEGPEQNFVGCRPAALPDEVVGALVHDCWLLGVLFQALGYVGRCSFDAILIGERLEACRVEFAECNGRWGGTSGPMTLVNRLVGDWKAHPYAVRECTVPGLERCTFADVLDHAGEDLFDARTGRGRLVFFNPARIAAQAGLDVLAFGATWDDAEALVSRIVPRRLAELAGAASVRPARPGRPSNGSASSSAGAVHRRQ
jgi:hypothetical protein